MRRVLRVGKNNHMAPIIKKVFLSFMLMLLTSLTSFAQQTLWVGQSYTFDVTSSVLGLTANMSWSTNGGYLSLSGSGFYRTITVTQYFSGTATVTCEWDYKLTSNSSYTHTKRQVTISCYNNQVSIYPASMTLSPGETDYVTYLHQFDNQYTSYANAYFISTNPSVATVDQRTGEVLAKSPGTTYINVYSKISSGSPYCLVTVKQIEPTSVSLPESLSLIAGEQKKLIPTLYPYNAQTSYSWNSSDPNIATISSDGTIIAKKHGKTTISVKTSNDLTASCYVTVTKPKLEIFLSLVDGLYQNGQLLHLISNYAEAKIYYTTDGSIPSPNSLIYDGSITLDSYTLLRAIAIHEDYIDSDIKTAEYDVTSLLIESTIPNSENNMTSISYPTICFNEILDSKIDKSNIHLEFDGAEVDFNAYIVDNKLIVEPLCESYYDGGPIKINIGDYTVSSVTKQPNCAIFINGHVKASNEIYQSFPVKVYAGTYSSMYLCNDGRLNSFGGWPTEDGYTYFAQYSFDKVISSCEGERIVSFVDKDSNLWVAGEDSNFFSFHRQPIIYQTGIRECAYANESTLFFVTTENELYGVGSDRFKQLLGKGNKINDNGWSEIHYYADNPVKLLDGVLHVYSYDRNCAVIKTDNSLYFWGSINPIGGNRKIISTPYKVADNVIHASIGNETPVTYILDDNTAWYVESSTLNKIKIADNVKYIYGGEERGYYITLDNKLYGWGRNDDGQLGNGTTNGYPYLKPNQAIFIMDNIIDVSCYVNYTLALTSNYEIYGWGRNLCKRFYDDKDTSFYQETPLLIYTPDKMPLIQYVSVPEEFIAYLQQKTVVPVFIEPNNGSCKSYEWKSSDNTVASISKNGIISPNNEGECNLTFTVIGHDDSIISKNVRLTVLPHLPKLITISPELKTLYEGESIQLEATVLPEESTEKTVIWSSSDENIASVSETGLVTAISEGKVIITAAWEEISATCEITVLKPIVEAEKIVLNFDSVELNIGEMIQLEAAVLPEDTTDKSLLWNSSDPNIATVSDNGLVVAISAGAAIITATCGESSAECAITVTQDAGIESLLANPDSQISVYSTDGILIMKDCKIDDLKTFNKGVYIIVSGKERFKISI